MLRAHAVEDILRELRGVDQGVEGLRIVLDDSGEGARARSGGRRRRQNRQKPLVVRWCCCAS